MTLGGRLFLALTAAVVMPAIGVAQDESPRTVGSPLTRYPVYDSPFSAVAVTTVDLRFRDGSRIARRTTARYFRDGAGRMRVEHVMEGLPEPRTMSERHVRLLLVPNPCDPGVVTLDPATRTIRFMDRALYALTTGAAHSFHIPVGGARFLGISRPESIASGAEPMPPGTLVDDESLGSRMLAGVETFGRRITVNTLAGQVGNDRPIVITDEGWYSPDLRLLIAADYSNSDLGTISYRLTGLSRSEPPADLFTVPDDYQRDHSSTPDDPGWMSSGVEAYVRTRLGKQPSRGR